ncbi:hypothetical protein FRC01_000864 [Tulasnella sp. 417]|nr:hypothetical protein FRC01_000864 [Tulasnella sp. 417]
MDLRPTSSSGSVYGVTLPRPATASFSSAGKDLWSASMHHHPLQQSHTPHQQQQLHPQQAQQVQQQPHSGLEPMIHSTPQEGSLSMWNAMPTSFVPGGGGFDNGAVQLTGHPGVDAFAHARKWSV